VYTIAKKNNYMIKKLLLIIFSAFLLNNIPAQSQTVDSVEIAKSQQRIESDLKDANKHQRKIDKSQKRIKKQQMKINRQERRREKKMRKIEKEQRKANKG
jgi:uncharacterized protein HemX